MPHSISRPNWVQIDLAALQHNARVLARHAAPARLVAVIKAGAYGHGAPEVARALQSVPEVAMLGVASVDEAILLRENGVFAPVLLLSALLPAEASAVVKWNLTPTVWTSQLAFALSQAQGDTGTLKVHFKVDTGMNRLGADWCEAKQAFEEVSAFKNLEIAAVYTHFACADEESELTQTQLHRFRAFCAEVEPASGVLKHAANSAGTLRFPAAHFDLVRPGIALYGAHPCRELGPALDLRPVMSWKAQITVLRSVKAGQSVSYGAHFVALRDMCVAVVPVGYADGYLRALSNRGEVLIRGAKCRVLGRVTMDQIMIDVSTINAHIGDEVLIWGQDLPVEEVAQHAGTISYELLCAVSSRVPRVYVHC